MSNYSRLAISGGLSSHLITPCTSQITVTDVPSMLPLIQQNIALNAAGTSVQALPLSWGESLPAIPSFSPPMVILAADCCYYEPAFPLLLDTLEDLLGATSDACCYFCFKKRRKADLGFVKMAKKRFEVTNGGLDDPQREIWQREGIFL